jgi:hypothetical protein
MINLPFHLLATFMFSDINSKEKKKREKREETEKEKEKRNLTVNPTSQELLQNVVHRNKNGYEFKRWST